jgi:hypothetical protein
MAALLLVTATTLSACGGQSATTVSADSPSSSASDSTGSSGSTGSTGSPDSALVVTRTGGIAGFMDVVQVAADGKGRITRKGGQGRGCTPSATALDRLRAVDLTAVAATTSKAPQLADGFTYSVSSGSARAMAGEGDDDSRRAELVDAAAAVVASCLASQSGSGSGSMGQ